MWNALMALAAAAMAVVGAMATPARADSGRAWWGPVASSGYVPGFVSQIPRPNLPGPVVYEYVQPGPVTYDYYALPPQYDPPVPLQPCWNSPGNYRFRAC